MKRDFLGSIISVLVLVAYYIVLIFVCASEDLIIISILFSIPIFLLVKALIDRYYEIKGGNEDDLSNY